MDTAWRGEDVASCSLLSSPEFHHLLIDIIWDWNEALFTSFSIN